MAIGNPDVATDVNADGHYIWATATRQLLVSQKNVRIAEVIKCIHNRIPAGTHMQAIYGAMSKPDAEGSEPEDTTWITSDEDLTNFLAATDGMHRPIML